GLSPYPTGDCFNGEGRKAVRVKGDLTILGQAWNPVFRFVKDGGVYRLYAIDGTWEAKIDTTDESRSRSGAMYQVRMIEKQLQDAKATASTITDKFGKPVTNVAGIWYEWRVGQVEPCDVELQLNRHNRAGESILSKLVQAKDAARREMKNITG